MYLTIYNKESGEQFAQLKYDGRKIKVVSTATDKLAGSLEETLDEGFDELMGKPGRQIRRQAKPHTWELMHLLADFYASHFDFVSVLTYNKPKNNMVLVNRK